MEKIYGTSVRQDGLQRVGKNRWELFYGFGKDEDNEIGYNWRASFDHQPTLEEVKSIILSQISQNTRTAIIEGYEWKGNNVWLSTENQQNYTLAYELVKNGDLQDLPTVKFGSDEEPLYYTFKDSDELKDFVVGMQQHIRNCLSLSWEEKQNVDWSLFE